MVFHSFKMGLIFWRHGSQELVPFNVSINSHLQASSIWSHLQPNKGFRRSLATLIQGDYFTVISRTHSSVRALRQKSCIYSSLKHCLDSLNMKLVPLEREMPICIWAVLLYVIGNLRNTQTGDYRVYLLRRSGQLLIKANLAYMLKL